MKKNFTDKKYRRHTIESNEYTSTTSKIGSINGEMRSVKMKRNCTVPEVHNIKDK